MKPLTVVQICADRGIAPGSTKGAAQHLRGIAAGLLKLGHNVVTYAARQPEGPHAAEVRALDQLTSALSTGPDVIYERYSLGHVDGLRLARRIGARFVLEVNAPLVAEASAHRPHTIEPHHLEVEQTLLREADLVISVSSVLQTWVKQHRSGPTATVRNGFEPAWFPQAATPPIEPLLVFIGHPKPWHGATRLADLLTGLADHGHRPRLRIIGGGPGADDVVARARRLGVAEQIEITGALPPAKATALLALATVGLAPYPRLEPFYFCPLKIIDYFAAGLPIVSTGQGDIADLVRDGGLLAEPDDDNGLVAAVARLLTNPTEAARMGQVNRRRAMATMTWDHAAAATAQAIAALDSPMVSV